MIVTENCMIPDMLETNYHADPTPVLEGFKQSASLSSSMALSILEKTPKEAMLDSRRLNPNYAESEGSDAMDIGTIAHSYVLRQGEQVYEIADFDDWRKNDAKAARARIEMNGLIALNNTTAGRIIPTVQAMRDTLLDKMSKHMDYPDLFQNGKGEVSGFAFDGTIWNRARFDWLDDKYPDLIVDYKTTGLDFDKWEKNELWNQKYMQSPHYKHVFQTITQRNCDFIFVVQQTYEPFDIKVYRIDRGYDPAINMRYLTARQTFIHCLRTGEWPGQPPYTFDSYPPPWIYQKWENDAQNQETAREKAKTQDVTMAG